MPAFSKFLFAPPTVESLEAAQQNILYKKTVLFKKYFSVNFDLTDEHQNEKYEKLMKNLFNGIQAQTHQVVFYDIQFVAQGLKNGPGHFVHIEWVEFSLKVDPVEPIGVKNE